MQWSMSGGVRTTGTGRLDVLPKEMRRVLEVVRRYPRKPWRKREGKGLLHFVTTSFDSRHLNWFTASEMTCYCY